MSSLSRKFSAFALFTLSQACGGSENSGAKGSSCEVGTERCSCYRNQTCDTGLTCASNLCVKLAGTGGSGLTGGDTETPIAEGGLSGVFGSGGAPLAASGGSITMGGVGSSYPTRVLTADLGAAIDSATCNVGEATAQLASGKLQLVVDIGSSVNNTAPGTTQSKWEVMRNALVEFVCGVSTPGLSTSASVGLLYYPNGVNDSVSRTPTTTSVCINTQAAIPMAMLGDEGAGSHRSRLRTALTNVVLGRGTPTADAYDWALNNHVLSPAQLLVPGDAYILLITDGAPTLSLGCYNPAGTFSNLTDGGKEIVDLVRNAWSQYQVKTFAIGLPESETARGWLSQAAYEGKTAKAACDPMSATGSFCHMDLTTAPDMNLALRESLNQVAASLPTCRVDVPTSVSVTGPATSIDKTLPIMELSDGTRLLLGRSATEEQGCTGGYRVIGSSQLELCADTCKQLQGDAGATLRLVFGCSAYDVIALQ